jgi:hypothetical protein
MGLACLALLGCNSSATLFSDSFINFVAGGQFPVVPSSGDGFVMVMGQNNTNNSVEFIVTAESEEIIADLDGLGNLVDFTSKLLQVERIELLTDVDSSTLAGVFDNSPISFPPIEPLQWEFNDVQGLVDQLRALDEQSVVGREFVRMVRVVRVGLGEELDVPSGQDGGYIIRPPNANPNITAGSIFPSNLNNALSYDKNGDQADFGNGDLLIYLATVDSGQLGGIRLAVGLVESQEGEFARDTFKILRLEEGQISPP